MTLEVAALAFTLLVHVAGAGVLVWALLDGEEIDWRSLWPRDDDGGGGSGPEPDVDGGPGDGGVVLTPPLLPDAAPSGVRLREPGRIAEGYPRPARRPDHAPEHPLPRVPDRA